MVKKDTKIKRDKVLKELIRNNPVVADDEVTDFRFLEDAFDRYERERLNKIDDELCTAIETNGKK